MTSPSSPSAQMAISTATVPLHIATQCSTPSRAAIPDSSSCTSVPLLPSHRRSQIPSAYRSRKSLRRLLGFGGYRLVPRRYTNSRGWSHSAHRHFISIRVTRMKAFYDVLAIPRPGTIGRTGPCSRALVREMRDLTSGRMNTECSDCVATVEVPPSRV